MTTSITPAHKDNLFGVCAALGEDFGFNPLWLRLALGLGLLWNMEIVIGGYFAVGAAIVVSRLLFPMAKPLAAADRAIPHATTMQDVDPAPAFAKAA